MLDLNLVTCHPCCGALKEAYHRDVDVNRQLFHLNLSQTIKFYPARTPKAKSTVYRDHLVSVLIILTRHISI